MNVNNVHSNSLFQVLRKVVRADNLKTKGESRKLIAASVNLV